MQKRREVLMTNNKKQPGIKRRGFASLTPERRKEIASMGGKASHGGGGHHSWKNRRQIANSTK